MSEMSSIRSRGRTRAMVSHLSSTSRRRLCVFYECKTAKRHVTTLPYTVAQRGGRIIRITCWQDNRGEGGGEFSVLRKSFMLESVRNPRRTLVVHCRKRRCRTLEVQRRTVLDFFVSPRIKWFSDVPAELLGGEYTWMGADGRACAAAGERKSVFGACSPNKPCTPDTMRASSTSCD